MNWPTNGSSQPGHSAGQPSELINNLCLHFGINIDIYMNYNTKNYTKALQYFQKHCIKISPEF